jgi:hypothetical protein
MVLLPGVMHLLGERAWWTRGDGRKTPTPQDVPADKTAVEKEVVVHT